MELELQAVVSLCVGAGNWVSSLRHCTVSSAIKLPFFARWLLSGVIKVNMLTKPHEYKTLVYPCPFIPTRLSLPVYPYPFIPIVTSIPWLKSGNPEKKQAAECEMPLSEEAVSPLD